MLLTAITFILILGLLIFIHELGHFTAAKVMGIKVLEFGFGLPPRLFGRKYGETEYTINALPIGGFVRLYGEDEEYPKIVHSEKHRAFFAKSPLKRSFVLLAGVAMNFLLGWFVISFLFTQGVMTPTDRVHVEEIAKGSPAELSGLKKEDIIKKLKIQNSKFKIEEREYEIKTPKDLVDTAKQYLDDEVLLVIERKSQVLEIPIVPRKDAPENEGAMGVTISNYEKKVYSWREAPLAGLKQSFESVRMLASGIGITIWKAITLQGVSKDIAGPIGIAKLTGQAMKFGGGAVLELLAMLSINLAVVNILPIPALDGGRLLFVVIEGVTGKRMRMQWEKQIHQVGMILLLILILLITVNDIVRLVSG